MITLFVLGILLLTVALPLLLVAAVVGGVLRAVFWLLFLPLKLIVLPFKLLGFVVRFGLGLLFLPLLLVVGVVVGVVMLLGAVLSVLAPLIPIALIALVAWGIYRATRPRIVPLA